MNEPISFPCEAIPPHGPHARLLGIYAQCQEGRFLQRVRIPLGQPTPPQWRVLAGIARRFTPGSPLHLTTRQDVELHDLTPATLPAAQKALTEAGLSGFASAGDTVRNVTICPCGGLRTGRGDLRGLAGLIATHLAEIEGVYALPRKFKISLSACPKACALPYINDLGLVLGDGKFLATVGGSLGTKPGTGIVFQDDLSPDDVLPLVHAAVTFFALHGDREHRNIARLRHVRQRMGDEAFLTQLRAALEEQKALRAWPAVTIPLAQTDLTAKVTLTFANGDLSPDAAEALADLAAEASLAVRIAIHHRVIVFGPGEPAILTRVNQFPALREAARPQPAIVACPGNRWCARGLASTNRLADRIRAELAGHLTPRQTICVSGCPNGCAHSAVAEIGLFGGKTTLDGQSVECFNLWRGGGMGRTPQLAAPAASKLTPEQVIAVLKGDA